MMAEPWMIVVTFNFEVEFEAGKRCLESTRRSGVFLTEAAARRHGIGYV